MKIKRLSYLVLFFIVMVFCFNQTDPLLSKSKKKEVKHWKVNVHFIVGVEKSPYVETWIENEIAQAERMYSSQPGLKINPEIIYKSKKGGKNLDSLTFEKEKDFHRYMDDYFDHVAKSKTTGYMRVLVTGNLRIGDEEWNGYANFPHSVDPFGRKHGPALVYPGSLMRGRCERKSQGLLAHELGHIFGLKHTWEPYVASFCNKDYKKGDEGKGTTLKGSKINLMDYHRHDAHNCPLDTYLNECQKDRAAKRRRDWMTKEGEVNYNELKGKR